MMKKIISEDYKQHRLTARPRLTRQSRWTVAVEIISLPDLKSPQVFYAEDGISYILEEEAAKECLNLGRNLVDKKMV
ncbi:hypothetical protein [Oceanispirochaeta sp.]|jgi:hypothetical protein|uniref:hypothetical protein n=1 Tax=Oceanispirochaeta sp. TaxID=2035350 RepID=UPI002614AF77|nr:hypothetical protein [Oceanispirochaeta sp.]MDA3957799.1 hypothetical protein [Oceanispirochaeta sp.]